MESSKNTSKSIRKFLRKFDFFGESFTFRYKDEDKHSTELGGLICITIYAIGMAIFIPNFHQFLFGDNFTMQYNSMKLNETKKNRFIK